MKSSPSRPRRSSNCKAMEPMLRLTPRTLRSKRAKRPHKVLRLARLKNRKPLRPCPRSNSEERRESWRRRSNSSRKAIRRRVGGTSSHRWRLKRKTSRGPRRRNRWRRPCKLPPRQLRTHQLRSRTHLPREARAGRCRAPSCISLPNEGRSSRRSNKREELPLTAQQMV